VSYNFRRDLRGTHSDHSQSRKSFTKEGEDGGSGYGVESLELTRGREVVPHDQAVDESKGNENEQDDWSTETNDDHCTDHLHTLLVSAA
jgi:hypothetical protein